MPPIVPWRCVRHKMLRVKTTTRDKSKTKNTSNKTCVLHSVTSGRSIHFLQRAERPKVGNTALYMAKTQHPKSKHKYIITRLTIKSSASSITVSSS
jgi:hypothetical protein